MESLVVDVFGEVAVFDRAGRVKQGREGTERFSCDAWVALAERFEEDRGEGG